MSHNHNIESNHSKAFIVGITLNIAFVIVEVFYGLMANSSALIADAGHNLSDVLSLIFAWFAIWLASKKPAGKYTYGFKKTTILISVLNALLLFVAVAFIAWDAIGKLQTPQEVAGNQIMIVAGIGVFINTITALMFMRGQKKDLNIRGAFLHMAADAAVSAGVVVSGLLIVNTGFYWIDPIMSFIIIIIIVWGTWKLFIESIRLALDAVPKDIDIKTVENSLLEHKNVENIHDLHIWAMSTTEVALSAHLIVNTDKTDEVLKEIKILMENKYHIYHLTLQLEKSTSLLDCENC
ncbi:MAG: cation transporter [Marinilabiliales bacterium]|nr:MAG: cation transporter [Marinilabiliales bacterium]